MTDAKPAPAPSMEDILASINRIIAEDRKSGDAVLRPVPLAAAVTDEVLELTEAIAPDGSVRHLAPAGASRPHPTARDRIVSPATSDTASASFARLAAVPRASEAEPPRSGGRILEDLVRDALRPLLQAWLDDHLPGIVERLVREEIARIAGPAPRP
jgi:uncharacterized protein